MATKFLAAAYAVFAVRLQTMCVFWWLLCCERLCSDNGPKVLPPGAEGHVWEAVLARGDQGDAGIAFTLQLGDQTELPIQIGLKTGVAQCQITV